MNKRAISTSSIQYKRPITVYSFENERPNLKQIAIYKVNITLLTPY